MVNKEPHGGQDYMVTSYKATWRKHVREMMAIDISLDDDNNR